MSLEIIGREHEGIEILNLNGRLTFGQENLDFRSELDRLVNAGQIRVALNLGELRKLDTTGKWISGSLYQAKLRPLKRCTTKQITAIINKMWIKPPATWKAKNPSSHNTSKTTKSVRNIEISYVRLRLPLYVTAIWWSKLSATPFL
jgi:hypothetical protein